MEEKAIAIPEIQRPFVWNSTKVRDLMDSLYRGYPVGYLIAWKNPSVRLKDGSTSEGKKILIDGQQRVTALRAAILGKPVITKEYRKIRIQIAFHPIKQKFEVLNSAIAHDKEWIQDISPIITGKHGLIKVFRKYCEDNSDNSDENKKHIEAALQNLQWIKVKPIGFIDLDSDLDIKTVTEIFVRINSKGAVLSQADFVMSKIASAERYDGQILRKCIDYFCHLAITPEFYPQLKDADEEFVKSKFFQKISWLKNEKEDLYDPKYRDLIRVAFTSEFNRGRLSDLVNLLSGRNFETRTFEDEIAEKSFAKFENGVLNFINETQFKRFIMIIRSAGFIATQQIRSQNVLNFAYILYLKLRQQEYNPPDIEKYVKKWFVLSILTGRYSGSPESQFDYDIKNISSKNFGDYLKITEEAELPDTYWTTTLMQRLDTSVSSSLYFNVFLAAQVKANDEGFLSKDIIVNNLISHGGHIHHIFPSDYLKKHGKTRGQYNQIANYVYMQSEINMQIGSKPPNVYFNELLKQCNGGIQKFGGIDSIELLKENLRKSCIPESIFDMNIEHYDDFLVERRNMIAQKIREYYYSLYSL